MCLSEHSQPGHGQYGSGSNQSSLHTRIWNKYRPYRFFPGTMALLKAFCLLNFGYFLVCMFCLVGFAKFSRPYALFKTLSFFFLTNFPFSTFIPCSKSIPDSRVVHKYGLYEPGHYFLWSALYWLTVGESGFRFSRLKFDFLAILATRDWKTFQSCFYLGNIWKADHVFICPSSTMRRK